jgi:hypothetical protein
VGDAQLLPERPGCRWICNTHHYRSLALVNVTAQVAADLLGSGRGFGAAFAARNKLICAANVASSQGL